MIKEDSSIAIFGLGHMGLPTAVLLAQSGLRVCGVDINKENVEIVNSGRSPIMEPGLDELVKKVLMRVFSLPPVMPKMLWIIRK